MDYTSRLCRSCMKEVASWERENFDQRIIHMFNYCTNIQIAENDLLPKQFCYDCTIKIESAYTYVKEAQHSNEYLTNLLTHRTVIVDPTKPTEMQSDHYVDPIFENDPIDAVNEIATDDTTENISTNESVRSSVYTTKSVIKTPAKVTKEKSVMDPKHVCAVCKKVFLSKVWYEKHVRNQKCGNVFKCSECGKTFKRPSQLSVHAVTHSAERRYACSCGKRYKRRKELAIHARTHSAERPYQCDHCHMSFKLRSVLKCHLLLHQPEKPHLCYICGCSFKQAGNLAVHMRAHAGARPLACACGYRAAGAAALRRHQARHRPRALRCPCGKAFHDNTALTRHSRCHTGARPYHCPAPGCARSFVDSWKRKLHLMRAHHVPLAQIPRMRSDPDAY